MNNQNYNISQGTHKMLTTEGTDTTNCEMADKIAVNKHVTPQVFDLSPGFPRFSPYFLGASYLGTDSHGQSQFNGSFRIPPRRERVLRDCLIAMWVLRARASVENQPAKSERGRGRGGGGWSGRGFESLPPPRQTHTSLPCRATRIPMNLTSYTPIRS